MEALVDEGLARNVGVSNFSLSQVKELQQAARIPIACNQVEIHPLLANDKLVRGCQAMVSCNTSHQCRLKACAVKMFGLHGRALGGGSHFWLCLLMGSLPHCCSPDDMERQCHQ